MLNQIEEWIDSTNDRFSNQRQSCVGLFGYLAKPLDSFGLPIKSSLASALFVPIAIGFTWMVVRSIRKNHDAEDQTGE